MGVMDWSLYREYLKEAAAAVKAATTPLRNRNKFTVPDEIREMAAEASKCRDPSEKEVAAERSPCSPQEIRGRVERSSLEAT